jgi:hypothetical protein
VLGRDDNIKVWVHYFIGDTVREIVNGRGTIRGINVKCISLIKIVSVTLRKCQIQIRHVSILH